ncbi:MAG: hypothetical protein OEV40_16375, partial [Acidimicrobiia bacterium]|nr:hypothetical protein [Acidimicrobiia bacterium]
PEPIEAEMGKQSTLVTRPLGREHHHDALHAVLRRQPAIGCYSDKSAAEAASRHLADRLVPAR